MTFGAPRHEMPNRIGPGVRRLARQARIYLIVGYVIGAFVLVIMPVLGRETVLDDGGSAGDFKLSHFLHKIREIFGLIAKGHNHGGFQWQHRKITLRLPPLKGHGHQDDRIQ
jgi:hypothetical protein